MRSLFVFGVTVFYSLSAFAQEAATAPAGKPPASPFVMNLPLIVMGLALFYFMIIAPQRKADRKQQDFQKSLARGDDVVTSGGILGKVAGLTDRVVTLEVSPGTEIKVLRSQIQTKLKELKIGEVVT